MTRYEVFSIIQVLETSLNSMKAKVQAARASSEQAFVNLDNLLLILELTVAVAMYKSEKNDVLRMKRSMTPDQGECFQQVVDDLRDRYVASRLAVEEDAVRQPLKGDTLNISNSYKYNKQEELVVSDSTHDFISGVRSRDASPKQSRSGSKGRMDSISHNNAGEQVMGGLNLDPVAAYVEIDGNAARKDEPNLVKKRKSDATLIKNVHEILREVIEEEKVDARAIFLDIDGNKNHVIEAGQFDKACELIGVKLSEEERNAIMKRYKHAELANAVRYMDLIDEACGLVATSKLVGGMHQKILNVDPDNKLTEAEEDVLLKGLISIDKELKRRDVKLLRHFLKEDSARSGKVSATTFFAFLKTHDLAKNESVRKLMARRFAAADNQISYVELERIMRTTVEQHRQRLAKSQDRANMADQSKRAN